MAGSTTVRSAALGLALAILLPAGAEAQDKPACYAGNIVEVEWNGQWYQAEVLDVARPDGTCPITYVGYDSSWDEAVPSARLREIASTGEAPKANLCAPGAAVDVEWQGSWYEGRVLEGPRPDGMCYITYVGWSSSWDEWVTPDRLRVP